MAAQIRRIAIDKLVAHPDNPNRMSKANFAKLVRNIERTGRYEPLVVRPCPQKNCHSCPGGNPEDSRKTKGNCFQIINGHHRWQALRELGYETADVVVWDIDDQDTDILLATLNCLGGSDVLEKKLALLSRLNQRISARKLAKLLPQTRGQIERLTSMLDTRYRISHTRNSQIQNQNSKFANPLVFFVNDKQQEIIENALSLARQNRSAIDIKARTKAAKNAAALTYVAQFFLNPAKRGQ